MDNTFEGADGYGRYQVLLNLVIGLLNFPVAYQMVLMYFSTLVPPWKCLPNKSSDCKWNNTQPPSNTVRCLLPSDSWTYTGHEDFSLVTTFKVDCGNSWKLYLISSVYFLGWGCGALFLGWIGDRCGRKRLVFPSLLVMLVAGFTTTFLRDIYLILVCRFVVGFCFHGTTAQGFILLSELVSTKYRPVAGISIYITTPVAWCVIALKAYLIGNWRYLSIACSAPYIWLLCFYNFVPESVEWLRMRGENGEVVKVLQRIARWNRKTFRLESMQTSASVDQTTQKSGFFELFRTRKKTLQCIVLGVTYFGTATGYYGIHLAASNLTGAVYRDFVLLNVAQVPSIVLAIFICNRLGRRMGALGALGFGSLACLAIAPLSEEARVLRLVFGMIGLFFINMSYDITYVWSSELFSTSVRSKGMGLMVIATKMGYAAAPWIVQGLSQYGSWIPFTVLGSISLLSTGVGLYLPETVKSSKCSVTVGVDAVAS